MMSKKKKTMRIKKEGIFIESEKTLKMESELEKINLEMVINHIKKDLIDVFEKQI